jgi:MoaA/NifB/PqqE/SkfB family radical SAM enzyme
MSKSGTWESDLIMETEKRYPYATVELTERCNLRCKHCYFFKDERDKLEDLPDQEIISRLFYKKSVAIIL